MKFVYWCSISDSEWSNLPLARRPVVGYLIGQSWPQTDYVTPLLLLMKLQQTE